MLTSRQAESLVRRHIKGMDRQEIALLGALAEVIRTVAVENRAMNYHQVVKVLSALTQALAEANRTDLN
jgi:hypothetical protein